MKSLAIRNIKLYFRDRISVFFSLLSVFIALGLYVLFLRNTIGSGLPNAQGVSNLVNHWMMAGILGVTAVTTTLAAFGVMVDDQYKKISKDFFVTPVKRTHLIAGYIAGAVTVGFGMTMLAFVLAEAALLWMGGAWMPIIGMAKAVGLIALSVLSSSAFVFLLISFVKTQSAFSTASTIVGTLIGFLTGLYVPMGVLPEPVQLVMKLFPPAHASALLRQVFVAEPMTVTFAGAPAQFAQEFVTEMGIVFRVGNTDVSALASVVYLLATSALFYGLAIWNLSRKKR